VIDLTKNVTVSYDSGSGGNMVYLSLLLALQSTHTSQSKVHVANLIKEAWDISELKNWKDTEILENYEDVPNYNDTTETETIVRITCLAGKGEVDYADIVIVVYTDIKTQAALSKMKNTYAYRNLHTLVRTIPLTVYNDVKDRHWPAISDVSEFSILSRNIQNELVNQFSFPENMHRPDAWEDYVHDIMSTEYNGMRINSNIAGTLDKANYTFILQDIVNTKFKCVTDALGLEYTDEIRDHIALWLDLHPGNIQEMLTSTIYSKLGESNWKT